MMMQEQFHTSFTENFFQEYTTDVFEKYEITEELREGKFGPICKVRSKDPSTVRIYTLKTIHLQRVSRWDLHQDELKNEIDALKALDHPHILKLYEVFYNDEDVHLLQEYTQGDDLYSRSPYSERDAARISSQLASAVAHMHENGVIHRALRFETIVFEHNGKNAGIKVTDFGVAKRLQAGKNTREQRLGVGSIYATAPEALEGEATEAADCWSMGVIMYMCLSAQLPFYAKRSKNMVTLIKGARYSMSGPVWNNTSNGAKHLVAHLLQVDSTKRYDSQQVLEHLWIRKRRQRFDDAEPTDIMLEAVDDSLQSYRQTTILKKLALNIIAHKSTTQEIIGLRRVFELMDTSRNGTVDFKEFKKGLAQSRFTDEEMEQIFESIDVDKSGQIQYTEFLAATLEARGYLEEERIAEAFQSIDRDGSGYIDREDLRKILGASCTPDQIDEIVRMADKNKDGIISYEEFFDVFRDQTTILAAQIGDMDETTYHLDDDDPFGSMTFDFDPNQGF